MRLLRDLTLLLLVLGGAVGFSQVPRFVQEYEQRLGGALQEVRRQVEGYRLLAARQGTDVAGLRERLAGSGDAAVAGMGRLVALEVARADELAEEAQALAGAGRLWRPLVLLRVHDPELVRATWAMYRCTLTLDLAFAALGALMGLLLNALLWRLARVARLASS